MADSKLIGSINMARLKNVGIMDVKGKTGTMKKCVVIPIEDNDIYIKVEEKTSQQTGEVYISKQFNLGIEIYNRKEVDQWGNVCYAKLQTSKDWIDTHSKQELEERNNIYLGNFKAVDIPNSNQARTMESPMMEAQDNDDLPF